MSDDLAKQFWRDIADMHGETAQALAPVRVTVVSESNGEVTLIRADNPDQEADPDTHPRIHGFRLVAGEDAYALPLGNDQLLVIGTLQNNTSNLDFGMDVSYIDRNLRVINDIRGFNVYSDNNMTTPFMTVGGDGSGQLSSVGTTALVGQTLLFNADSPIFVINSQASSDTASTTNTATMQTSISANINLGSTVSTWNVFAFGSISMINSAGATARICATIDGVDGNIHVTPALNTATYTTCVAATSRTGIAGNTTISCQMKYRCGSANTTTAANPQLTIIAKRTG